MTVYRSIALAVSALSAAAMLYVGLYQSRFVGRLICPIFADGCEGVADVPFARPFGIPDGYIGTALYVLIAILLLAPAVRWVWFVLLTLSVLATVANTIGVRSAGFPSRDQDGFGGPVVLVFRRGIGEMLRQLAISCQASELPDKLAINTIAKSMIMIMLQDFMDPWTFNQKKLMKCCKQFLLPGGKQIPFCAYNTVGRASAFAAQGYGTRTAACAARGPTLSAETRRV